jgi:hypothetical protein
MADGNTKRKPEPEEADRIPAQDIPVEDDILRQLRAAGTLGDPEAVFLRDAVEGILGLIDLTLIRVRSAREEAHGHDEEIARLGEETRRLIAEMQRDVHLKAA